MHKLIALAALLLAVSGCASVAGGGLEDVTLRTIPEDARIRIVGRDGTAIHEGTAPASVTLERGNSYFNRKAYEVTVSKAGYQPKAFRLTWSGGWNFGELVIGERFGLVLVDPATGMVWKVDPRSVSATLEGVRLALASGEPHLIIVTPDNAPLGIWKHAVRLQ